MKPKIEIPSDAEVVKQIGDAACSDASIWEERVEKVVRNLKLLTVLFYRSRIRTLLVDLMGADVDECKSCGAKIYWIKTKNGRSAPIDLDGLNHFGSCQHAKLHRKIA